MTATVNIASGIDTLAPHAFRRLALVEAKLLLREPLPLFWGMAVPMVLLSCDGGVRGWPRSPARRAAVGGCVRADLDRFRHGHIRHGSAAHGPGRLSRTGHPAPAGHHAR